ASGVCPRGGARASRRPCVDSPFRAPYDGARYRDAWPRALRAAARARCSDRPHRRRGVVCRCRTGDQARESRLPSLRRRAVRCVQADGPDCRYRVDEAGEPRSSEHDATTADSLGAPSGLPNSSELCRPNVDALVRVTDDELRVAMRFLLRNAKIPVEPAGAAATAALLGPLRERLRGKAVALVVCGSNIDAASFAKLIAE